MADEKKQMTVTVTVEVPRVPNFLLGRAWTEDLINNASRQRMILKREGAE